MRPLCERVHQALGDGRLTLPPIGGGQTAERWAALVALAADDIDLARLAEAHVDAVQILAESDTVAAPDQVLGVWAAEHPDATVTAAWEPGGERLVLTGSKAFCSGAGIVDAALVTVAAPEGTLLVQVPVGCLEEGRIDATTWKVRALDDVQTATVDLTGIAVSRDQVVGDPGWYLDRPGFWDGATGPAACWAGAAIGLVRIARRRSSHDPHALAHLGAMSAGDRALRSVLDGAGREQDAAPAGTLSARRRALEVRHIVDAICADIEERFARCLGPRALALDAAVADRLQALSIYRRQCHGERDLAVIGADIATRPRP